MSGQLIRQSRIWKPFKASYNEPSKITIAMTKLDQSPMNQLGYIQQQRHTNFLIFMK